MLSLDQVIEQYKSNTLDGRDLHRLADFVPVERWDELGLKLAEGVDPSEVQIKEWNQRKYPGAA